MERNIGVSSGNFTLEINSMCVSKPAKADLDWIAR